MLTTITPEELVDADLNSAGHLIFHGAPVYLLICGEIVYGCGEQNKHGHPLQALLKVDQTDSDFIRDFLTNFGKRRPEGRLMIKVYACSDVEGYEGDGIYYGAVVFMLRRRRRDSKIRLSAVGIVLGQKISIAQLMLKRVGSASSSSEIRPS